MDCADALDEAPGVQQFTSIPKNHHLIAKWEDQRAIKILRWFSNDYFNIIIRDDGKLQFNDLRYGSRSGSFKDQNDYVFRFILEEIDGELIASQTREGSDMNFDDLFTRIKGIKELD